MGKEREDLKNLRRLIKAVAEANSVITKYWSLVLCPTRFKVQRFLKLLPTFVKENSKESILDVAVIVLANLCVASIMTNANKEAEDIMNMIEKEENKRIPDER